MFATGNVLVISDSTKSQLETEELEWNNSTHKLHSQAFVRITSPKEIINGWGFESDENLSNYKIFKVNGVIVMSRKFIIAGNWEMNTTKIVVFLL